MKNASLLYKPDWPEAQKRWIAFWECAPVDRPCICVRAPRQTDLPPLPLPESMEDVWLDPDYVTQSWLRMFETTYFGGEAVPTGFLLAGYVLGCGPNVKFKEKTIWHPVIWSGAEDHFNWYPGPEDPWRHKLEKLLTRLLEAGRGKFLVHPSGQVPLNDLLVISSAGSGFLARLAEDCDKCAAILKETFPRWIENLEYFRNLVDSKQTPNVGPGFWYSKPVMITQSDISCMISGDMFDRYVLREMDMLGEKYERIWYHLDGPGAIRHLPKLLKKPYIRVISYQPLDVPNGPAFLDMYRTVQAAGKCLDIKGLSRNDLEFIIRHLKPEGLEIRTTAENPEQADELLHLAAKWAGTHINETI